MYITIHKPEMDRIDITFEEGPNPGTWEVTLERGARWRVRSPQGHVEVIDSSEPWMGDLAREFENLMRRIAPRAVVEAMHRERAARGEPEEPRAVGASA